MFAWRRRVWFDWVNDGRGACHLRQTGQRYIRHGTQSDPPPPKHEGMPCEDLHRPWPLLPNILENPFGLLNKPQFVRCRCQEFPRERSHNYLTHCWREWIIHDSFWLALRYWFYGRACCGFVSKLMMPVRCWVRPLVEVVHDTIRLEWVELHKINAMDSARMIKIFCALW